MSQSQFIFRGGHLCLDFLNTVKLNSEGDRFDLLQTPADFAAWLRETNADGFSDDGAPGGSLVIDESLLESARQFRTALRELAEAITEKRAPSEAARADFNAVLRTGAGHSQLGSQGDCLTREFKRVNPPSKIPPTLGIAESALRLITGDDVTRIRRCESPTCILYFLDTSKNHSRRWCSMEACGNRHKAAAHYLRQRGGASTL